ncbi:MAG: hypothetical protein Q7T21_09375, partial [Gallionella sp.]|nr:hypothetical protein [Gallionella sp.]
EITAFTISVSDGVAAPVTDTTTTVVTTSVNDAPTLGGITALTSINDTATATPFSAVTIADADTPAQTQSVSITLDTAAKGALSNLGGGAYNAGTGVYTFTGTAAQAQTAIRALVFTPTANRVNPTLTETTTFTVSVSDGIAPAATDATTTVVSASANDAPVIGGATAVTNINDTATTTPFSAFTITDADAAQTQTLSVTLDTAAKGSFTTLNGFTDAGGGVYTFSGTAAAAQTAVRGLVFTPTANRVNPTLTETTTFTVSVSDGIAAAVTNAATTVVSTSVNDAPTLGGATALTSINNTATATPFSAVTITDADAAQTQTLSVTLDTAAKGVLSNLGGGTYNALTGVYTFSGTAAAATTAVQGLVFTPAANRVTPGSTETTTFTISVSDGVAAAVTDNITTVVATNATFPPPTPVTPAPEPLSQPPVVENIVKAADTETTTKDSQVAVPLPFEAKASDVFATSTNLLEEKTSSANSTSASSSATSQDRREGTRANLNPANAAALFNLDPEILADFQIGIRGELPLFDVVTSAIENHAFIKELDQLREHITADAEGEKHIIGASVAVGTGLSIGYVLWLLRGGVLLSSLLSALPAWRFIDPLPVLGRLKEDNDEDDEAGEDESLESLVIEQPNKEHATPEENKNA